MLFAGFGNFLFRFYLQLLTIFLDWYINLLNCFSLRYRLLLVGLIALWINIWLYLIEDRGLGLNLGRTIDSVYLCSVFFFCFCNEFLLSLITDLCLFLCRFNHLLWRFFSFFLLVWDLDGATLILAYYLRFFNRIWFFLFVSCNIILSKLLIWLFLIWRYLFWI